MFVHSLFLGAISMLPVTQFWYPHFANPVGLDLVGSASRSGMVMSLTPAQEWVGGGIWHHEKVPVADWWETEFTFRISDLGGAPGYALGADGFALVIHNTPGTVLGNVCCIGYAGIPNSIAIEIDTFATLDDPSQNHISVHTRGLLPNSESHAFSLGSVSPPTYLSDSLYHTLRVYYSGDLPGGPFLQIFLDGTMLFEILVDLDNTLNLDNGTAWMGIVAGTGACWQAHWLKSWTYYSRLSTRVVFEDGFEPAWSKTFP